MLNSGRKSFLLILFVVYERLSVFALLADDSVLPSVVLLLHDILRHRSTGVLSAAMFLHGIPDRCGSVHACFFSSTRETEDLFGNGIVVRLSFASWLFLL